MLIEHARSLLLLVDLQEKLMPAMAEPLEITRQIGILIEAARVMRVPVLASEQYPAGLGTTVPDIASRLLAGEILPKMEFSCYANSSWRQRLMEAGDHVIIAGIEAHICVLQTALDLLEAGKRVFVVGDAVSSRRADSKVAALQRLASCGAVIVTTEMVVFEWLRQADRPEFKPVSRLIR